MKCSKERCLHRLLVISSVSSAREYSECSLKPNLCAEILKNFFRNEYGEENLEVDPLFTYHIKVCLSSVVMCLWRTTNWSPAFARLVNVVLISRKLVSYVVKNPLISHRLFEFLPKSNHYGFSLFQLFVLKLMQEIKTKLNCS